MGYVLLPPFIISPRLKVGLQVEGAWIQLEPVGTSGGRIVYRRYIDLPDGQEFSDNDLKSGVGFKDSLQEMFVALLDFLLAAVESYNFQQRTGREEENTDLFPQPVVEWAAQYSNELKHLRLEVEEEKGCIVTACGDGKPLEKPAEQ